MNDISISYLITFSTETQSFKTLLNTVYNLKDKNDEMVLLSDSGNLGSETASILENFIINKDNVFHFKHDLNKNYSEHKNYGMSLCKKKWIFQIDGDEIPTGTLLCNIKEIIRLNSNIESFWIARINDFKGVTDEHAKKWGWRLSPSSGIKRVEIFNIHSYQYKFLKNNGYIIEDNPLDTPLGTHSSYVVYKAVLVNAYDPQCRLFLNEPNRIKWVGKLHEHIEGNRNYVYLPDENESLALYHYKTIEKQIETNLRYNKEFTEKENQGFNLPK